MKAIWRGEDDELGLRTGKTYEILSVECDGKMYNVIDETGGDYLYPAEDFEIIKETEVITAAEAFLSISQKQFLCILQKSSFFIPYEILNIFAVP